MLTEEERKLLKSIYDNPYAIGAFSGMVFNAVKDSDSQDDKDIEEKIKLALRTRIKMRDLAYGDD